MLLYFLKNATKINFTRLIFHRKQMSQYYRWPKTAKTELTIAFPLSGMSRIFLL
jgi:hypothetical protein